MIGSTLYMGFGRDAQHPEGWWGGIGVAYAPSPRGPFARSPEPMIALSEFPTWARGAVHEHDHVRLKNGTYVLM